METLDAQVTSGRVWRWHEVWIETVTKPSVQTFKNILDDPIASAKRAYLWVAIVGLAFGILEALVYQIPAVANEVGLSQLGTGWIVGLICPPLIWMMGEVIRLAIGSGIQHGVAHVLGGTGKYTNLVYCNASYQAPLAILYYLISLIILVARSGGLLAELVTLCISPFSLVLGIYFIVFNVKAISAAESMSVAKAGAVILIMGGLLVLLGGCLAVFSMFAAGQF